MSEITGVNHSVEAEDGWVTVEVVDLSIKAGTTEGEYQPENRNYKSVQFLENGYIRCEGPKQVADDEGVEKARGVCDYYSPPRVNCVMTTESSD